MSCDALLLPWFFALIFGFGLLPAFQLLLVNGGAKRDRTADPLRARQVLSQLSYSPILLVMLFSRFLNRKVQSLFPHSKMKFCAGRLFGKT